MVALRYSAREETMDPDELVEDYLDHLCAPLVGIVPYLERRQLRCDAAFFLERLSRDAILEGMDRQAAVVEAIRRYGDSQELSERFLAEWTRYRERGALAQRLGLAKLYGSLFFGQATLWGLLMGPQASTFFVSYCLVAPLFAGVLVGRCAPTVSARALMPVILGCTLLASLAALFAFPGGDGVVLPAFQILWWLPAGGFVAQAVAALTRRSLVRFRQPHL